MFKWRPKHGGNTYYRKRVHTSPIGTSKTAAIRNAISNDGVYLPASKATIVCRATKDFLTGLNNSRIYDSYYNNCIRTSLNQNEKFSILMLDIDYFKSINDTHGHLAGNIVLKEFGEILLESCRDFDFVSRVGGEEFSVILQQCSLVKTMEVAERIRKNVEDRDFTIENGKIIHITVSIGVAVYPDTVNNGTEVAKNVDKALYKAKQSGRNRVCL